MRLVHGCRHGDDDEIGTLQRLRVARVLETPGSGELFGLHLARGIDAARIRVDLLLRKVEADRRVMPAELDGERKADIAEAYDGDGFTGCGHMEVVSREQASGSSLNAAPYSVASNFSA